MHDYFYNASQKIFLVLLNAFGNMFYLGYEYESQNWDSEDIPATERDLAEDAPWKQIQVIHFNHAHSYSDSLK